MVKIKVNSKRHRNMSKNSQKVQYYISHKWVSWQMKESDSYMSVHDQLHHRQYGCSDGACMGDGLASEGATTMILSVHKRELVGGMDE